MNERAVIAPKLATDSEGTAAAKVGIAETACLWCRRCQAFAAKASHAARGVSRSLNR
jgi:hypothetical protein